MPHANVAACADDYDDDVAATSESSQTPRQERAKTLERPTTTTTTARRAGRPAPFSFSSNRRTLSPSNTSREVAGVCESCWMAGRENWLGGDGWTNALLEREENSRESTSLSRASGCAARAELSFSHLRRGRYYVVAVGLLLTHGECIRSGCQP